MRKKVLIALSLVMLFLFVSCNENTTNKGSVSGLGEKGHENLSGETKAIKHTINFNLSSSVYLENTKLEYVEGEGLSELPVSQINNENDDEKYQYVFVYWYSKGEKDEPNEVITSISKDEKRDLELYPRLVYKYIYDMTFEKYNFEIEDGRDYPSTKHFCLDSYPSFNIYGVIELDKETDAIENNINGVKYYQVKCQLLDIYDMFKLTDDLGIDQVIYDGNCNSDGSHTGRSYFVNMSEDVYLKYQNCKKFIFPLNVKYNYGFDETYNFASPIVITYPKDSKPISTIEYQIDEKTNELFYDFYPVIDGKVVILDQSEFIESGYTYQSYIIRTYRTYICDRLSDTPTFDEFDSWLVKCYNRIIQRTRYGAIYHTNW